MPRITDAEALSAVEDALKVVPGALAGTYWVRLAAQAHAEAEDEVTGQLLARGFTPAQAAAWDRGASFVRDIAVYWALTKGGLLDAPGGQPVKGFDRRAELKTVQVFVGGEYADPSAGRPGTAGCGVGALEEGPFGDGARPLRDYLRW